MCHDTVRGNAFPFFVIIGAPIFYSSPHFLYGSQKLQSSVKGMNPIQEQHKVDFDVEMVRRVYALKNQE